MTFLNRLRVLTTALAVLAATAAVATSLLGDFRDNSTPPRTGGKPDAGRVVEELAATKFSQLPAITYRLREGETLFAWQIRPTLDPVPPRPRDVLVMVDTSASQAGRPLQQARQILQALSASLTADDRISVWKVSTPAATGPLTKDYQSPSSEDVRTAAVALTEVEYGSGATDLKTGLAKALATIQPNRGRQQVLLFLGDGESAFNPVTEDDRVALGSQMDNSDVFFFAVPLGLRVHPNNLHGFASLTGGAVVRLQEDLQDEGRRDAFVARLKAALDAPVLKADKFQFGREVAEVYPTRLPPLRADRATLVVGKLANPAGAVSATVSGKVAGKAVTLKLGHPLPPSQPDHYFLNLMVNQWRDAPHKDAPAMLQADRALALASTQVKLYRDEFLTQAVWAVTMGRFEDANGLYCAAQRIDPNDSEAAAGLSLIEKMKSGKITKADLAKRIAAATQGLKFSDKGEVVRTVVQDAGTQPEPKKDEAKQPSGPPPVTTTGNPPAAGDAIKEAAAMRKVEEDRYRVLIDNTIRRARQLLRTDPDGAYQDLKRQRDDVLAYEVLGDAVRGRLITDLEAVMREVYVKGAEIKRQAASEREQIAEVRQRLNEFDRSVREEDRTKARIDAFRQLMQRARYELAYQEAQLMIQERISRGLTVPEAAVAGYIIGQQATQLREWRELVRIRQDRFLLTMMQTEKSAIPYPDEPPVHYPPAAVWRELTALRKEKYTNQALGEEASPTQKAIQSKLENQRVTFEGDLTQTSLSELLGNLAKKYEVNILLLQEDFKDNPQIADAKPKLNITRLDGLTLGAFLDVVLQSMGATYIVRPDYIEVTTFEKRLSEKVTRVFPVADLVIPIPQAVNQQMLFQNLALQNAQLQIFGQASLFGGGLQQLGGAIGIGGGFGNNPLLMGGGAQGGFNPLNAQLGQGGQAQNLGLGGGIAGVTGGNLGQFGNLGGQFGLQGGNQSQLLIRLIHETVARGEWLGVAVAPGTEDDAVVQLPNNQKNALGYYDPARALIVHGSSRYHPGSTIKLKKPEGMAALPAKPGGGVLVFGPGGNTNPAPNANPNNQNPKPVVAANTKPKPATDAQPLVFTADNKPKLVDPKLDVEALVRRLDKDPRRMWQQAVGWTVTDPKLIVAVADCLMENDEFAHAAEVLKAGLRKGLTTDDWAHDALAVALQMSQANPVEVERAAVSAIDLDPTNPRAYLKAAKVESELNNHDMAVAFCQRAAKFGPDQPQPYANALAYAEKAKGVTSDTVEWAASNLLHRDWSADGIDYQTKVRKEYLPKFTARFQAAGQKADKLSQLLAEQTQRDLMIELIWEGTADLDLIVVEPSGAVCDATHKRTSGGGVLQADQLEQKADVNVGGDSRSEVYTAASAFSGTYKVSVKRAFGQTLGDKARLKVTRFMGTPKQTIDVFEINLASRGPVEIKLDGGSRNELAVVTAEFDTIRSQPAGEPARPASGIGGGFGTAGAVMAAPVGGTRTDNLPLVTAPVETREPGIGGAADLRASFKLNPDRKTYQVEVKPVFATAKGKDVPLPKVPLLPGGE
jgi:tetratricopeptide (TPR) repeat protein